MSELIFPLTLKNISDIESVRTAIAHYIADAPIPNMDEIIIKLINDLCNLGRTSSFLIGELLVQHDGILQNRFTKWKQNKNIEFEQWNTIKDLPDRPAKSLHEWFCRNEESFSFTYSMAREYIKIFEMSERDTSDKLGPAKMIAINRIPEKYADIKEQILDKAIDNNWTVRAVQEEVDTRLRSLSLRENKKGNLDIANEAIKISLVLDKNYVLKVIFNSQQECEAGLDAINDPDILLQIKQMIYNAVFIKRL